MKHLQSCQLWPSHTKKQMELLSKLCVCALCVCICMYVLQMDNSNRNWDSSQDNSFTAWTSLFLYSHHHQKEGKLQSSFIQLLRKRVKPTLSSNSLTMQYLPVTNIWRSTDSGPESAGNFTTNYSIHSLSNAAKSPVNLSLSPSPCYRAPRVKIYLHIIGRVIHLFMQGCAALAIGAQEHRCAPQPHQL